MEIDTRTLEGVKILTLTGRLSMGPALDRFNATMNELLNHGQSKIILNLEGVPTIDSSGIGLLSKFLTSTKQSGGSLKLVAPSKFVVQTLKLVGLLNLFEVFPDVPSAVASFG